MERTLLNVVDTTNIQQGLSYSRDLERPRETRNTASTRRRMLRQRRSSNWRRSICREFRKH